MKIKMGGTIGFKVLPNAYEPVTIETTYEIENDKELSEEDINNLTEKINKKLEKDLKERSKIVLEKYLEFRKNLKNAMN